jgi:mxaJ protein
MSRIINTLAAAFVVSVVLVETAATQPKSLRVCGDPDNLPFSNEKLEGFENKIAATIAADLGATPSYAWWPHQRGLVRNTIDAGTCDVIFGIPEGLDFVLWTKPYYHSSYVIAYRKSDGLRIASLDALELSRLRIGVYTNTPVEESLARRHLLDNVSSYSLFFDPRGDRDRPAKLLDDLVAGIVDIALPWGPLAGYYAKKLNAPIELVPLKNEPGVPLSFGISMGVKKGNRELKSQLEAALDRRQSDIRMILEEYGVPLVPAHQPEADGARTQSPDGARQEPAAPPQPTQNQPEPTQNQPPQPTQSQPPQPTPDAPPPAQDGAAANGTTTTFKKLNPFTGNADMISAGKTLYFQVGCQGCHGGGGGGGMAASLIDDLWKFGSDDETLFKLIKGQVPGQTMPVVYSTLPDDQIWELLAFIRSVYKGDPSKINW